MYKRIDDKAIIELLATIKNDIPTIRLDINCSSTLISKIEDRIKNKRRDK